MMSPQVPPEQRSSPILALLVHLRIEVAVVENDGVRSGETGQRLVHGRYTK